MRGALCIAAVALWSLHAAGETQEVCASAWQSAVDASGGALSGTVRTDKGWCAVAPTGDAVLGVPLSKLRFRLDQLALPTDGRSLEVTFDVVETDIGILEGVARVIWDPARSSVTLDALTLEGEDGRRLKIKAELIAPAGQDDDLDPSSIASLALEAASVQIVVTPQLLNQTGIRFSDLSRVAVDRALRNVGPAQLAPGARNEFQRFVGAAPNARGSLLLDITAENRMNLFDVAAPFIGLGRAPNDDEVSAALARALDGMRIGLEWKPGRM